MPERTQPDHVDTALRTPLEQPSYAARTATTAARWLDLHAAQPITNVMRERALDVGTVRVLSPLPDVIAAESTTKVYGALPPFAPISCGEYALRLRAAAKGL